MNPYKTRANLSRIQILVTTYKFDEAIKILRYILLEITLSQFNFLTFLFIKGKFEGNAWM